VPEGAIVPKDKPDWGNGMTNICGVPYHVSSELAGAAGAAAIAATNAGATTAAAAFGVLQAWCVWMILGIDNLGEFSAGAAVWGGVGRCGVGWGRQG
jgi:hypothetical protein